MAASIPEIVTNSVVIVTNVVTHDVTGLDVVNNVNQLYSGMFNSFLVMVTIIAGLVGIVIPVLLQRYQRQEGKFQEERLNADFRAQLTAAKVEIEQKFTTLATSLNNVEARLQEAGKLIEKKVAYANGLTAQIDAVNNFESGRFYQSARAAIFAIVEYLKSDEEENLNKTFTVLINCCKHLTKQNFEDEDLAKRFSMLESQLKRSDVSDSVKVKIDEFFAAKSAALKRNQ